MNKMVKLGSISLAVSLFFTSCTSMPMAQVSPSQSTYTNPALKILQQPVRNFSVQQTSPSCGYIDVSKSYLLSSNETPDSVTVSGTILYSGTLTSVNVAIDGVKTVNIPTTTISSTCKGFSYTWDGKNASGATVDDGFYNINILRTSTFNNTLGLHAEIEVTSNPMFTLAYQYIEPSQVSLLGPLLRLNAPVRTADALEKVVKEIAVLNERLQNLSIRTPSNASKIAEVQAKIDDLAARKTELLTDLQGSLSYLQTKKTALRNHINNVSGNASLSEDYPVADKPLRLSHYKESIYFQDYMFSDSINERNMVYVIDNGTFVTIQESYETDPENEEQLKPYMIFEAADLIADQIQLLGDLVQDYQSGSLQPTATEVEIVGQISSLVSQLHFQSILLEPVSAKTSKDMTALFDAYHASMVELKENVQIPLALAMREIPGQENNPYIIQALKPMNADFSLQQAVDWQSTMDGLIQSFLASPYDAKVIAVRYYMHYDENQWNALPLEEQQEIIEAFTEIVGMAIPVSRTDLIIYIATGGPIGRAIGTLAGRLSKNTVRILRNKATTELAVVSKLDDILRNTRKRAEILKQRAKKVAETCSISFGIASVGFSTQSTSGCGQDYIKLIPFRNPSYKGKTVKPNELIEIDGVLKDPFAANSRLANNIESQARTRVELFGRDEKGNLIPREKRIEEFFKRKTDEGYSYSKGVTFTAAGEVNFNPYAKAVGDPPRKKVVLEHLDNKEDFKKANAVVNLEDTPDGYVWHHCLDGRSMILIPKDIHELFRHTGGAYVIKHGLKGKVETICDEITD